MQLKTIASIGLALMFTGLATQGMAQVRYAPYPEAIYPFGVPLDETLATRPSYQIDLSGYARAPVRVIRRCAYPDGWNVTDFSRDVNGIPAGVDHACR